MHLKQGRVMIGPSHGSGHYPAATVVQHKTKLVFQDFKIQKSNLEFRNSRFQDFKISRFENPILNYRCISRFLSSIQLYFKIFDLFQDFKISRFQDFKISRFQDLEPRLNQAIVYFKILIYFKISRFQDFKISRFWI